MARKTKKPELWIVLADGLRCGDAETLKAANDLRDALECKTPKGYGIKFTVERSEAPARA